jgi:hypothetical protein
MISNDRAPEGGAVNAQLVSSARMRLQFQPCPKAARGLEIAVYFVMSERDLTRAVSFHFPTRTAADFFEGEVNAALSTFWCALNDRPVSFTNAATREQLAKFLECFSMPSENEAPRCIAIKAMPERRRARQTKFKVCK